VNDGSRLGKIATDYAYYGLTDPEIGQSKRDDNSKADTDAFIAAMWDVLDGAGNLLLKKHRDYGPSNIAGAPGGPLNGLRVRMWDKTARINHLIDSGATPENESLRDSFIDLLNYSAIALLVLDGKWPE
jgi:hypothetical protein